MSRIDELGTVYRNYSEYYTTWHRLYSQRAIEAHWLQMRKVEYPCREEIGEGARQAPKRRKSRSPCRHRKNASAGQTPKEESTTQERGRPSTHSPVHAGTASSVAETEIPQLVQQNSVFCVSFSSAAASVGPAKSLARSVVDMLLVKAVVAVHLTLPVVSEMAHTLASRSRKELEFLDLLAVVQAGKSGTEMLLFRYVASECTRIYTNIFAVKSPSSSKIIKLCDGVRWHAIGPRHLIHQTTLDTLPQWRNLSAFSSQETSSNCMEMPIGLQ